MYRNFSNSYYLDISISFGPNPRGDLIINYNLLKPHRIEISVYDVGGRLVWQEKGMKEKGQHNFVVNNLASGVYFLKFDWEGIEIKRKVILLTR